MKALARCVVRHALTLAACIAVFVLVMVGSAAIPQRFVQAHFEGTGAFYAERGIAEYYVPGVQATQLHYYADGIWASIAYGLGADDPIETAMWTPYYVSPNVGIMAGIAEQIDERLPGNVEYVRYWHGPAALVRVLHLALDIQGIYTLLCVATFALLAILAVMLVRRGMQAELAALVVSLFMVSAWIMPLCLEYVWMLLVALVASIVALWLVGRADAQDSAGTALCTLMLVTGAMAAFLDFLTCETLTLVIPLALALRAMERGSGREPASGRSLVCLAVRCCLLWGIGYVVTWTAKWLIAGAILRENIMPYVSSHVDERGWGATDVSVPEKIATTLTRNFGCLLVFEYGTAGAAVLVVLALVLVVPVVRGKVRVRHEINRAYVAVYTALALVPIARYLVLLNHSYGHYVFTYRALAGLILAGSCVVFELVEHSEDGSAGLESGKAGA